MRTVVLLMSVAVGVATACQREQPPSADQAATATAPRDAQHQGVTGPHGDHTPHHGGLVLMNGDVHYEVVLASNGRHEVWFSDAMRNELPASIVPNVTFEVMRPGEAPETVRLVIDEAGEAWTAAARPLAGDGILVKVRYALDGTPHEIEVPFTPGATPQSDPAAKPGAQGNSRTQGQL
jgi:hypothetical protein